jgi:hypothetical protein
MSDSERAKLNRLLINIELLTDVEKAANNVGISSKLLHRWTSTPEISWAISEAMIEGQRMAKGEVQTFVPLWVPPELMSNRRFRAKRASQDLKAAKGEILVAIEDDDKEFFIDLGRCLSGEIDTTDNFLDRRECYVAGLLTRYPTIAAKDAVDQIARAGFPRMSEENFRMLKKRMKNKVELMYEHHVRAGDEPEHLLSRRST